jgi:hypothetical protein
VTGASGHQIQIPFVIKANSHSTYIQPVAYGPERVEWKNVYRGLGVMLDLKNAGAQDASRAIVIEDSEEDLEIKKAVTLLSIAANVIYFSKLRQWVRNYHTQ